MSWSIEERIGELRPWPDAVRVVRGKTDETRRYVPEDLTSRENAELRELVETLLPDAMENVCSKSYWCDEKDWQACGDKSCGSHLYVELARELGIEVEG